MESLSLSVRSSKDLDKSLAPFFTKLDKIWGGIYGVCDFENECVRLKKIFEVYCSYWINTGRDDGKNPTLIDMVKKGDLADVLACLTHDPNMVNQKNEDGETPLMWACQEGKFSVVQLLVKYGAEVNVVSLSWEVSLSLNAFGPGFSSRSNSRTFYSRGFLFESPNLYCISTCHTWVFHETPSILIAQLKHHYSYF